MNDPNRKIFSVTLDDCRVDTFRSGGKGGQNQNKVESGVRIVHEPSGAVGESREFREQLRNKKAAFLRMTKTPKFQTWIHIEANRKLGKKSPEQLVEEWLAPGNLRFEGKSTEGKWIPYEDKEPNSADRSC